MEVKNVVNLQSVLNSNVNSVQSQKMLDAENQSKQVLLQSGAASKQSSEERITFSSDDLKKMADDLREKLSVLNTQLKIEIEKVSDNGREVPVVKIVDKKTDEVIRQIPPEYMLKVAKYIDEITGLLLDKKA